VPFFLLTANLMNVGGITDRLVTLSRTMVGNFPGALAQINVLLSVFFAGISGSSTADAASQSKIFIEAQVKEGYGLSFSIAITAVSAVLAVIIPPSILMVVWGGVISTSIGALYLAGVIPGVLMGLWLMALVAIITPRQGLPRHAFAGLCAIWTAFKEAVWALLAPVILLAGMFSGLFTPTEAAAVADLYALILGFVVYRTLRIRDLPDILINTAETTGIVMVLVMVAGALGWCMSISRIPQTVAPALVAAIHQPLVFLFVANVILLVVGCFMEALAALLILIPILVPAAVGFGIDPVQFGLIMIFNLILGTIHPPIGVVLFVMARIADVSFEKISRAILPWLVPLLLVLAAITTWPPLTLWLPGLLMGR